MVNFRIKKYMLEKIVPYHHLKSGHKKTQVAADEVSTRSYMKNMPIRDYVAKKQTIKPYAYTKCSKSDLQICISQLQCE